MKRLALPLIVGVAVAIASPAAAAPKAAVVGRLSLPASTTPTDFDVADLNGDGYPDVVATLADDTGHHRLWRYLSDGQNGFSPGVDLGIPFRDAVAVKLRDFDKDGRPDLVMAQAQNGSLATVKMTWARGVLTPPSQTNPQVIIGFQFPAALTPGALPVKITGSALFDVGDINGDGRLDIAFATDLGIIVVFNNGSLFQAPAIVESVALRDATGDGLADFLSLDHGALALYPATADPAHPLSPGTPYFTSANEPHVAMADLQGTGRAVAVVGSALVGWDGAWHGVGSVSGAPSTTATGPAVIDVNGDGRLDIVDAFGTGDLFYVHGTGGSTAEATSLAVANLDAPRQIVGARTQAGAVLLLVANQTGAGWELVTALVGEGPTASAGAAQTVVGDVSAHAVVTLDASATTSPQVTSVYTWTESGHVLSSTTSPTVTVLLAGYGPHTIQLRVEDDFGVSTAMTTVTVTVPTTNLNPPNLDTTVSSRASAQALTDVSQALAGKASAESVAGLAAQATTLASALATLQSTVTTLQTTVTTLKSSVDALPSQMPSSAALLALQAAVGGVRTAVDTRSSQLSVDVQSRLAIERALGDGVVVISFTLPANAGGQLDAVRQIVGEAIVGLQQININTAKAAIDYAKGERAFATGNYRTAYDWYVSAYQRLLK